MNRREIIILLGSAAVTLSIPLLPFKSLAGRPRYRHRKGSTQYFPRKAMTVYLHRKSKIIRYGKWEHTDPTVQRLKLGNYEAVALDDVIKRLKAEKETYERAINEGSAAPASPFFKFGSRASSRILEAFTLDSIRTRQYEEAHQFLWANLSGENVTAVFEGIYFDERLHDLLAALTVRFGSEKDYGDFISLVCSKRLPDERAADWRNRLAKWDNKNSKWYRKWKDRNKAILWAGLLM